MREQGHRRPGVAQPQAVHLADVRKAIRSRTPASPSPLARPTGLIDVPLGRIWSISSRRSVVVFAPVSVTRIESAPSARTIPAKTRPSRIATVYGTYSGEISVLGEAILR